MRRRPWIGKAIFFPGMALLPIGAVMFGHPGSVYPQSGDDRMLGVLCSILALVLVCLGAWMDTREEEQ